MPNDATGKTLVIDSTGSLLTAAVHILWIRMTGTVNGATFTLYDNANGITGITNKKIIITGKALDWDVCDGEKMYYLGGQLVQGIYVYALTSCTLQIGIK